MLVGSDIFGDVVADDGDKGKEESEGDDEFNEDRDDHNDEDRNRRPGCVVTTASCPVATGEIVVAATCAVASPRSVWDSAQIPQRGGRMMNYNWRSTNHRQTLRTYHMTARKRHVSSRKHHQTQPSSVRVFLLTAM